MLVLLNGLPYAKVPAQGAPLYIQPPGPRVVACDTIALCVPCAALGQSSACVLDNNLRLCTLTVCGYVQLRYPLLCMLTWLQLRVGSVLFGHACMHHRAIDNQHHL
jgi:hypothetical protein